MSVAPVEKRRRPTYADIAALPSHVLGEILAGELVVSPRPAPPHAEAASALGIVIGGPFGKGINGPGGWRIVDEPELSLGIDPDFDPVVPDLGGWRRERLPRLPATAQYQLPPDWICEVLSPGTAARDRAEKMPFYARAGVGHAWLIDPLTRVLEVYRLEGGRWIQLQVHRGDVEVRAEPFEAVALPLRLLWED